MKATSVLVPLLVVRGAASAIDFYVQAFSAVVLARFEHGNERRISHADLEIAGSLFALTEEARAWNSDAPPSLGGSPVVLQLEVNDTDAVLASMLEAGATVVFPAGEFLGERMARARDPFGHLWLLRQRIEKLSNDELQRRRDALFALTKEKSRISEGDPLSQRARFHVVLGAVGAGKSTFALELSRKHNAVRLTLDAWMATLFSADRPNEGVVPWYVERAERCVEQIWSVASTIAETDRDVVLEPGLLERVNRERFFDRVDAAGFDMTVHVLDAERAVRRERVLARNQTKGPTFSVVVPHEVFELASDLWEPLDEVECEGRDVRFLRTDQ
jgi:uncharacterized glyoxalase superfamily protein PhnB/predicted kinase